MVEGPGLMAVGFICMVISGVFLSTQQGINFTLGRHVGKSFAAVVSFATGCVALLIFFTVDVLAMNQPVPNKHGVQSAPWWSWIGGPLGAFYVSSIIIFAPILGAGNATSVFVAAQIITSVVLDSQGWVGFKQKTFHWQRALGVLLLVGGVILITQFDGAVVDNSGGGGAGNSTASVSPPPAGSVDGANGLPLGPGGPLPPGPLPGGGRRAFLGAGGSSAHSQVPLIGLTASTSSIVLEPVPSDSSTSEGTSAGKLKPP